jgi:hypothetical protein
MVTDPRSSNGGSPNPGSYFVRSGGIFATSPDPKQFAYTFDHIASVMNDFTQAIGSSH